MTQPVTPIPIITTSLHQPLGDIVPNWTPRHHPLDHQQYHILQGQYCRLELLNSKTNENIIQQIYDAFKPTEDTHFTYLAYGPFKTIEEFKEFIHLKELPSSDTVFYSILVNDIAVGFISFLRINQPQGTIEIGHLNFSSQLVQTRSATEANYLLLQYAFDILGYRRVEWKCYALNAKSRRAALRFGYQYEGTWLKAEICKGRSRDNAWFSIVDDEWIQLKPEFQRWLSPENFDSNGQQLTKFNAAQINPRSNKNTNTN
jgi:RimJ/RimL family protein N-acetyltransferase